MSCAAACRNSTFTPPGRSGAAASRNRGAGRSTSSARWRGEFRAVAELLAAEGLSQERRALRCAVRELRVEAEAQNRDARASAWAAANSPRRCCARSAISATICRSSRSWTRRAATRTPRRCRRRSRAPSVNAITSPWRRSHAVDRNLQDRAARTRAIALAVNDPDAAMPGVAIEREEFGELVAGRGLTQAVQIQFVLDGIKAAAQAAQHLSRARRAGETTGRRRRRWHPRAGDPAAPAARRRSAAWCRATRRAPSAAAVRAAARECAASRVPRASRRLRQRLHVAHRGAKRQRIVVGAASASAAGGALVCPWCATRSAIRVSGVTV